MSRAKKALLISSLLSNMLHASYVTYDFSGGRFGDNLLAYIHARWISYAYKIPLLYKPFEYSDKLQLHLRHTQFNTVEPKSFERVVNFSGLLGKHNKLPISDTPNTLYIIPYFPHCEFDIGNRFHFDIDWNDKKFISILHSELASIEPVAPLKLPKDRHLVALHVRTGAGHDKIFQLRGLDTEALIKGEKPIKKDSKDFAFRSQRGMPVSIKSKFADKTHPLKFASDYYYVNQVKKISELLSDEPMYVHLFTDSSNPEKIAELYSKLTDKPNVIFGHREQGNQHNANVLEDFYALQQFDYLIRSESNFSIVAGFLKDYRITIFPKTFSWIYNYLEIDEVEIQFKNHNTTKKKNPALFTSPFSARHSSL